MSKVPLYAVDRIATNTDTRPFFQLHHPQYSASPLVLAKCAIYTRRGPFEELQRYLAHEKKPTHPGPPWDPGHGPPISPTAESDKTCLVQLGYGAASGLFSERLSSRGGPEVFCTCTLEPASEDISFGSGCCGSGCSGSGKASAVEAPEVEAPAFCSGFGVESLGLRVEG